MNTYNNVSLRTYNTFNIDVQTSSLIDCKSINDVDEIIAIIRPKKYFILGGGSNVLFMSDFDGYIVRPLIEGLDVLSESKSEVSVKVGAGVVWDDFVRWCVEHNLYGVENLSGIPGNVGASPVQNIGAYGAEAANVIREVDFVQISNGKHFTQKGDECHFAYRNSIFKNELRGDVIITNVTFALRKIADLKLEYGAVRESVEQLGGASLENVRRAIIDIRNAKLPDPRVEGNAGSFFKNPEIDEQQYSEFIEAFPNAPSYSLPEGRYKIPAGWLIEQCGWKGRVLGHAGVHARQALVLVNKGGATGNDIMTLANAIIDDVRKKFGITISMEVNMID